MEIILKKQVENLGEKDDLVTVKPGYARNFLIPKGFAVLASASAKKVREENIRQRAHKEEKMKKDAEELVGALGRKKIKVVTKVGENGKIFGSVNNIMLAEAIKDKTGHEVDRKGIKILDEVKTTGSYKAEVKLHRDVVTTIEFEVSGE